MMQAEPQNQIALVNRLDCHWHLVVRPLVYVDPAGHEPIRLLVSDIWNFSPEAALHNT